MKTSHHYKQHTSRTTRSLIAACALLGTALSALGADPLYQWNFDSSDGANTGTGSGGTLALNVGIVIATAPDPVNGYLAGSFNATGVSGNAFNAQNAYDGYNGGQSWSSITNAAAVSNLNLTGLTQFTITMWIKRDGQRNVDLLNIGSTTTPTSASNPSISIGLDGTWANGVRVGVNGSTSYTGDLWSAGTDNDWVFVAFAYTATEGSWWSPTFGNLYFDGAVQPGNGAIITGDMTTAATVAQGVHMGGAADNPGLVSVTGTSTMFLANSGTNTDGTTNGFNGQLDDIRIYSSLLSVAEIEAVRAEASPLAIPEPSSYAFALGFIAAGGAALRRRRRA